MVRPDIPDRVLRFIAENIDSVPQLEALLLLSEHPGQSWNAETVATRIYVRLDEAASILAALQRRRLVERGPDAPDAYGISAAEDTRQLVAEVNGTYRANVVVVTR